MDSTFFGLFGGSGWVERTGTPNEATEPRQTMALAASTTSQLTRQSPEERRPWSVIVGVAPSRKWHREVGLKRF